MGLLLVLIAHVGSQSLVSAVSAIGDFEEMDVAACAMGAQELCSCWVPMCPCRSSTIRINVLLKDVIAVVMFMFELSVNDVSVIAFVVCFLGHLLNRSVSDAHSLASRIVCDGVHRALVDLSDVSCPRRRRIDIVIVCLVSWATQG